MYFLWTIVPRKYMPIISAVGLFCFDKFEETPNEKVVNTSKLTKSYFSCCYAAILSKQSSGMKRPPKKGSGFLCVFSL